MCDLVMIPNKKHGLWAFSWRRLHKSDIPWTRLTGFQGEWARVLAFEKAYFQIFSPYLAGFYISPSPTTFATMGLWAARKMGFPFYQCAGSERVVFVRRLLTRFYPGNAHAYGLVDSWREHGIRRTQRRSNKDQGTREFTQVWPPGG
jgi:hypothetical protein